MGLKAALDELGWNSMIDSTAAKSMEWQRHIEVML